MLYPLTFIPIYKPKVWGGRALARLGRRIPDGDIGESWELADLSATSSAGGGASAHSVVADGGLAGRTLHDLIDQFGPELLGDVPLNESGEFPLLLKYLDATHNVSVQVHPDAAFTRIHPESHVKSEAWYIVAAEPEAVLYNGLNKGVTPEQLSRAVYNGDMEELLQKIPARVDECHYVPSGVCHAIGAGIMIAEVQTSSDTTFRLYDWGRDGRALQIDQAMQCVRMDPCAPAVNQIGTCFNSPGLEVKGLVQCEHFRIERFAADAGKVMRPAARSQPVLWMFMSGKGRIASDQGAFADIPLYDLRTIMFPAALGQVVIHIEQPSKWLEITFPQSGAGVIA